MEKFNSEILVTRPYLPSLEEFKLGCEEIWENQWLTNNGPVLRRFERKLADYLCVPVENIALFNNGTLALEMGFQAMGLAGSEIITTPFTFVATAHAIKRIGATPVFADIDPETMCLNPAEAEKKITPRTKAIVPVHVYGHPCDVDGFEKLAQKYNLKIIYDAAHAFGVKLGGKSIAEYGEMAMFSFHPTKLFHSCEGGLLVFKDASIKAPLERLRNFAILSETECSDVGTNAKMNELQALMGELCLAKIDELIDYRRKIHKVYAGIFSDCSYLEFLTPKSENHSFEPNDAYCPVLFKDFETREKIYAELKTFNIFARRYFYPLLTDFKPYRDANAKCPVAEDIAKRVLTLPTYFGLDFDVVRKIGEYVKNIASTTN